jgi:hypothetical protein
MGTGKVSNAVPTGGLKAQILAECDQEGASVAKVAMAHGINVNIVHGCGSGVAAKLLPARQSPSHMPNRNGIPSS